jgi:hypothetical protein
MQGDHRLPRARRAGDARRTIEAAIDDALLAWVEEDDPSLPRRIQRRRKLRLVADRAEAALRVGMGEGIGGDGRFRDGSREVATGPGKQRALDIAGAAASRLRFASSRSSAARVSVSPGFSR